MKKAKGLEELEDEFNSLTRKRSQMIVELDAISKELVEVAEKIYEQSPDYVRVDCLQCMAKGTIKSEEGKLTKCPMCDMRGYIWCKKFKGETK